VLNVHNDYTECPGRSACATLLPQEADRLLERRFAIIQVWRAITSRSSPTARDRRRDELAPELIRATPLTRTAWARPTASATTRSTAGTTSR